MDKNNIEDIDDGLGDLFSDLDIVETKPSDKVNTKEEDISSRGIPSKEKIELDLEEELEDSGFLDDFLGIEADEDTTQKPNKEGSEENPDVDEVLEMKAPGDIAQVLYDKHEFELPPDFNPETDAVTEKVVYDMFITNLAVQKEVAKKEGQKLGSDSVLNSIRALNPEVQAIVSQAAKNPNQDFKSLVNTVNQDARLKAVGSLTVEKDSIDIVKSYLEAEGNTPNFVKSYLEKLIESGEVKDYAARYLEPLKTKLRTLQGAKQAEADKVYAEREAKDKLFVEGLSGYFTDIAKGEGVATKVVLEDSKIADLFYSITRDEKVNYKGGEVTMNQLSSHILKLKEVNDYTKLLKIAAIIKGEDDLLSALIGSKGISKNKKTSNSSNPRKKVNLRRR